MTDTAFLKGWGRLRSVQRFYLAADDPRADEYFEMLHKQIGDSAWLTLCTQIAMSNAEATPLLPSAGEMLEMAQRTTYTTTGGTTEKCSRCGFTGAAIFIRCVFAFDGDRSQRQVNVDLPADAHLSLAWFDRLPQQDPVSWNIYQISAHCDCRKAALTASASKDQRPRAKVYSEVVGAEPTENNHQKAAILAAQLPAFLEQHWPLAKTNTPYRQVSNA